MGRNSGTSLRMVWGWALLFAVMGFLAGCPRGTGPLGGGSATRRSGLLGPVAINIHDSSAVIRKKAGGDFDGLIVACEVLDRFDDSIKAVGVMRFEAYDYAPSEPENKGGRVGFWPGISINSLESIQQHWDDIWGLYRFNLTWEVEVKPGQRFVLEATLTTASGEQFSAKHILHVSP